MNKHQNKGLFAEIAPYGLDHKAEKGELLIKEGENSSHFFLILEGAVEIVKKSKKTKVSHSIAVLKKGALVGELALVDNTPRSASVRVLTPSRFLRFELTDLDKNLRSKLVSHLIADLSNRLHYTTENIVASLEMKLEETQARNLMETILVRVLVLLGVYILIFRFLISQTQVGLFVFVPLMVFLSFITFEVIKRSGYAWETFGITLKDWKKSAIEGVLFTLPVLGLIVVLKWILLKDIQTPHSLFEPATQYFSLPILILFAVGYALFAPLQELIVRGVLQSLLTKLLSGTSRVRIWKAIVLSNLLFTSLHSYFGIKFTFLVFLPGLYFGWLYQRQKNLIGVSVAHALIGIWALYIVNIWPIL